MQWFVDELLYFRGIVFVKGWAYCPEGSPETSLQKSIVSMSYQFPGAEAVPVKGYGLPSPDLEHQFGRAAQNSRFEFHASVDLPPEQVSQMHLVFRLADGSTQTATGLVERKISTDPYHALHKRFFEQIRAQQPPFKVLEIGSRNRSGHVRKALLGDRVDYVGMDIVAGDNVDVVGDAHALSHLFPQQTFDAVFSISVFEHLLMPWKAAIEINHVLKPGGLVMIATHQTFPLHETPWDFWRFSDQSWHGLFNDQTGFKILDTALGESAAIVAHLLHAVTADMDKSPAYLATAVLCQKTQETALRWDANLKDILETLYPQ
ncbi:MAG TPA: class I SAM-dependent methyltransferase [Coleofasciculaceae cyanobacterium]|jgi:SAM-dependent methyltransferase